MNFFAELGIYYVRKVKEALRNTAWLFMSVFTPLMYLLLFMPLLRNLAGTPGFPATGLLNVFMPGIIVLLAVYGGSFQGFRLIDEIRQGIIERFRVTPTSRLAMLLGAVLRDVTNIIFQSLIITAIAIPFGLKVNPAGFIIVLIIIAMITSLFASMSYLIGLKLQSEDALAPIVEGITLPILLLGGFLLPMSLAPAWLQGAAHFDPVYYAVEASRNLLLGNFNPPVIWETFAVMIPLLSFLFWLTARAYRNVVG